MSAEEEGRTEQPSSRKLEQARSEGQVPVGHDAALAATLAAGLAVLGAVALPLRDSLTRVISESMSALPDQPFRLLPSLASGPIALAAAACFAPALGAAAATLVQTQGGFWPNLALPDLNRVFRPAALGRMFSRQFLTDLALAAVKVSALGAAAWSVARADFDTLPALLSASPSDQLAAVARMFGRIGWRLFAVAAVVAGIDFGVQRHRFMAKLKMTKDELKREHKEEEGDPLIRGKRRQRHRELSKGRAAVEVPRADALLVNPTHVAIALRYRRDEGKAPRVVAKGKGALAEFMRDLARTNGVPIVEDIPLARLLYRRVKVGREVPAETYKAVAAVLAFVFRLTGKQPGGRA
ncbi:MAG TPA: EscU/YscU/HrcU family type III secretion system export apparatus switch protein [Anaeromyxobacteraceae bacterium]|nr:EscU/YscU/HrcU family type III secretion system export apparatus switch protein [Anaeromyxobacteraceae bacterium]